MEAPQGKYKIIAFKDWVPQKFGFVMLLLFGAFFQLSLTIYLGSSEESIMAMQMSQEEIMMAFQTSLIGMVCVFPIVFRLKFRFKSKNILLVSIAGVMIGSFIATHTHNFVVLIMASFILGVFRMVGTFESFSSIQLLITPKRDFGIWFTFIYGIILICVQSSGIISVNLGHHFGWQSIYYLMQSIHVLMLVLVTFLMRPINFMPPVPLKGIDWRGAGIWAVLFTTLSYIFIFGQEKDWFNSDEIKFASLFALFVLAVLLYSYRAVTNPYIGAKVFTLRSIVVSCIIIVLLEFFINTGEALIMPFQAGVMRLDAIHLADINYFTMLGVIVGAIYCFWWFRQPDRSYKSLFFIAFSSLMIYHLLMSRLFSASTGFSYLLYPYFFKGIGYLMIYAGVGKYLMADTTFETFPQGWFVVALVRNAVGSSVISRYISEWHEHKTMDFMEKLATNMQIKANVVMQWANQIRFGTLMSGQSMETANKAADSALYGRTYLQASMLSAREIYIWITFLGVAILLGILMYHFTSPFTKRFGDKFWKA